MAGTTFTLLVLLTITIIAVVLYYATSEKIYYPEGELNDARKEIVYTRNVMIFMAGLVAVIYIGYEVTAYFEMEAHVLDWLNLIVRWAHVVLGISWIGASFYFIFLENSLNRTDGLRDELAGNLWAIHGGGFYYVEKYKVAPTSIPRTLHWFKFEAYFTWLTGFLLMTLVYYMNAKAFMLDPGVSNISASTAVIIGIGTLLIGWVIYDLMCKSPLLKKPKLFGFIGLVIVIFISWFLSHYLSGRAAFMHVGALLGTIMAANVFFTIIPSQKALVAAAKAGRPVDPTLGKIAGLRSLHNNYITLPVIFVMISNHFPSTFGPSFNWIVLAVLTIAGVIVRHFINLYEKGRHSYYLLPLAAVALLSLVIITAPKNHNLKNTPPVKFSEVQPIFQKKCVVCHSKNPTDETQPIAPGGVMFDTPQEIQTHADRIFVRAVETKTMPQGNKTGISDEERELIGRWIKQGAILN